MQKEFQQLNVNDKFTYNNKEYTKVQTVKITCCKSINAQAVADNKDKIFVQPSTKVEV